MDEPCTHPVQVSGLCAICGVELETLPPEERAGATDDEPVSILHSHASLKVTRSEAARLHAQSTSDLLNTRRLALIIDLDQTVIHATVDPTVGEWMKDKKNPNNAALRDVKRFRLGMDGKPVSKKSKAVARRARAGAKGAKSQGPAGSRNGSKAKSGSSVEAQQGDEAASAADEEDEDDDEEETEDEEERADEAGQQGAKGGDEAEAEEDDERDDDPSLGCWYYIKPRPGLPAFLRHLSTLYELHVYTMGTRSYAASVCAIIDPDGTLFADRILSRDENDDGAASALANPNNSAAAAAAFRKSLARLFPVDTSMVVIIDDRADVWKWSPNLVKVVPFDFFVGIGDINASFLPAAPAAQLPTPPATPPADDASSSSSKPAASTDAALAPATSGAAGGETLGASVEAQAAAAALSEGADAAQRVVLETQAAERPLAKMQEALEEEASAEGSASASGAAAAAAGEGSGGAAGGSSVPQAQAQPVQQRAAVLKEDDRELHRLQRVLNDIHSQWYRDWDRVQAETNMNLSAALSRMPDVANVIAKMKSQVLRGCHIVFSGVVPLGQNLETSEPWRTATEFGARCHRDLTSSVTHLVAARGGTAKVYQAQRQKHPRIWIVRPRWLAESCERWARSDESAHALLDGPDEAGAAATGQAGSSASSSGASAAPPGAPPPFPAKLVPPMSAGGAGNDTVGEITRIADDDEDDGMNLEGSDGANGAAPGSGASVSAFGGFEALDWGEAADEVDAFLDGLDDEGDTTDGGYGSDASIGRGGSVDRSAKRTRADSEESDGGEGAGAQAESVEPGRSPLSKRRRIASARAGQSKLKHSFDPSAADSDEDDDDDDTGISGSSARRSSSRSRLGRNGSDVGRHGAVTDEDDDEDGDVEDEHGASRARKRAKPEDDEDDEDEDVDSAPKRHALFQRRAGKSAAAASTSRNKQDDDEPKQSERMGAADNDDDEGSVGSQIDESFLDGLADEIALDLDEGD